jgi:serine/threonine protein kinase
LDAQVLRALKHPNIVELFEVIHEGDNLYMIMELCTGGELWHFLQVHFTSFHAGFEDTKNRIGNTHYERTT